MHPSRSSRAALPGSGNHWGYHITVSRGSPAVRVPEQVLQRILISRSWQPVIDGKFITDFPSKLLASGKFVKVPTIGGKRNPVTRTIDT
jgi:hypothetical protein